MLEAIKEISKRIKSYDINQVELTSYCRGRMKDRGVEETLVLSTLFSTDFIFYVEE